MDVGWCTQSEVWCGVGVQWCSVLDSGDVDVMVMLMLMDVVGDDDC